MGAYANDDDDMVEVEHDLISQFLTILPKLRRKQLQLHWDNKVIIATTIIPLYISLPNTLEFVGGTSILNISVIQLWHVNNLMLSMFFVL